MSFYPQPNKYQCGPFALKYALVIFGIFKHENEISDIAGSSWWAGTDEIGLEKASRAFNCRMAYFHADGSHEALKHLNDELKKGFPCILSVDDWEHWFTVLNYHKGKYIIVDSGYERVFSTLTPNQLLKRWIYAEPESDLISYDGYSLRPAFRIKASGYFTFEKARQVMHKKNMNLARKWDTFFNDLITICRPRQPRSKKIITFSEFLRRHQRTIISEVAFWHGTPTHNELRKLLKDMQFITEVYNLIIPEDYEKKAVIDITAILMMYSCGKYGMDPLY